VGKRGGDRAQCSNGDCDGAGGGRAGREGARADKANAKAMADDRPLGWCAAGVVGGEPRARYYLLLNSNRPDKQSQNAFTRATCPSGASSLAGGRCSLCCFASQCPVHSEIDERQSQR
jgi:hypothetical protein